MVDPEPSWKALIAALRIPAVNYPALASEIEQKICINASIDSAEDQQQPVASPLISVNDHDLVARQGSQSSNGSVGVADDSPVSSTPKPRPVPKPRRSNSRTKSTDEPFKRELVQSFEGATSNKVTQDQIERAKVCIKDGGSRNERYSLVEFDTILNENKVSWL